MISEMARQLIPQVLNSMQTMWHHGFASHWSQYFQRGQFGPGQFGRPSQGYFGQYGQYGQNYYGQYGQYGQYGGNYGQFGRRHW